MGFKIIGVATVDQVTSMAGLQDGPAVITDLHGVDRPIAQIVPDPDLGLPVTETK